MAVNCPLCGQQCKNHFYLGKHVAQKDDPLHNGENTEEDNTPDLEESFQENQEQEDEASDFEWETEEDQDDGWRELDSSDPMEAKLLQKGHSEINMDSKEVR